ncbi:MAG: hypothetical protein R3F20_10190 [Planctomycetota bacterium]
MSARTRFWLVIGAAALLAVVAWALSLPRRLQALDKRTAEAAAIEDRLRAASPGAVGEATVAAQRTAQIAAEKQVEAAVGAIRRVDRQRLDHWFDDLGGNFKSQPSPADFKRYYLLECDALQREAGDLLEARGRERRSYPLVEFSWVKEEETPDPNALRAYQRIFWVQDRVIRALAAAGAELEGPLEIGEPEALGGVAVSRLYDGIPVRGTAIAREADLRAVLHAFDRSATGPDTPDLLPLRVRNLEITPASLGEGGSGAGRVRVVFELHAVDLKN